MASGARQKTVGRAVYGAFVVVIALFTFTNIWQVAHRVFGQGSAESPPPVAVSAACGEALGAEIADIERARLLASTERTGDAARARYARERTHKTLLVSAGCEAESGGQEALAALARLDRAAETHAVRESSELSPVRLAAQSFIRGPNP